MTPLTPYLIRAYNEWILDNQCTPYIVVDTYQPDVQVPMAFVQPDGQITLNINPQATGNLSIGVEAIEFNARFSGQVHHIYVPCHAVVAIFAKETGQGTAFAVAPAPEPNEQKDEVSLEAVPSQAPEAAEESEAKPKKKRGSHLRVVK